MFRGTLMVLACVAACFSEKVPTWTDPVTGLTCDRCPAGTHVVKQCTATTPTECGACPANHYTEFWNYLNRCLYCGVRCTEQQVEKSTCSATHNRVCECKPGYHIYADDFCLRHSTCPPGQGLLVAGTPTSNTRCGPCQAGYFSAEDSTEACKPHTPCKDTERSVPGTATQDTFCTSCQARKCDITAPPAPDKAVCDDAFIDFVERYPLNAKKAKNLMRKLRKMGKGKTIRESFQAIMAKRNDQPLACEVLSTLNDVDSDMGCRIKTFFLGWNEDEC
ncbi:membrane protein ORF124 [Anguillid herpesvirus 1]|uniref:Membrane protein ORF124 n=1 Tax=Anguillid herpesvirus 1 TaxID=150286 RepID=A0A1J0REP7_9VIRU|nr:membrane protein ORF124 [Anguillid herpesvirus 1]ADA57887.1 membrane protein ORF124 [Anguillid herpesvirus 1]APD76288.1 membrane protein ORF124 [Anguillid herpesvirus 1]QRM16418.1 membrane protein ORF124 [Anguillid herpesvirus 1]QRM16545.1 membrane protein ORF124 [Anguillid herpesvirus 1]QRM16677.1 membrane protein ORF124 [Anguillid herpesvirus 1]